jgi:hypothetical protein
MSEEKKGHVRITMDIEINEALMELVKEGMANIPQMMTRFRKKGKAEE